MTKSGFAIASLVLGILSILIGWIPIIGWAIVILAIVFGIVALTKMKKDTSLEGKGMAIAGIVLGALVLLLYVILIPIGMLAYFGVLSPDTLLPERTTFQAPLPNVDNALVMSDGTIEVAFSNNLGTQIEVLTDGAEISNLMIGDKAAQCTAVAAQVNDQSTPAVIDNSQRFIFQWQCQGADFDKEQIRATLSFKYKNVYTGQTRTQTGSLMARVI